MFPTPVLSLARQRTFSFTHSQSCRIIQYPFVTYKHNVIEALGHQALILLYATVLILRHDDAAWQDEGIPKVGYGYFIVFISVVVLPSPTDYFYYKDKRAAAAVDGPDDSFEQNPLAKVSGQSDVFDVEASDPPTVAKPARAKLAKMQREAKDTRAQNQKQQVQVRQLQTEITALKANATANVGEIATLKAQLVQTPQMEGMELLAVNLSSGEAPTPATPPQAAAKIQEAAISGSDEGTC